MEKVFRRDECFKLRFFRNNVGDYESELGVEILRKVEG